MARVLLIVLVGCAFYRTGSCLERTPVTAVVHLIIVITNFKNDNKSNVYASDEIFCHYILLQNYSNYASISKFHVCAMCIYTSYNFSVENLINVSSESKQNHVINIVTNMHVIKHISRAGDLAGFIMSRDTCITSLPPIRIRPIYLIVSYVDCSNSNMTCLIYRLHDTAQLNGLISKLYPVK